MEQKTVLLEKSKQKGTWTAAGLEDLVPAFIAFVLIAIVGAVGALILTSFYNGVATCTNGAFVNGACTGTNTVVQTASVNVVQYGMTSVQTISSFLPLLGLVVVAAAIIGVVLYAFTFRGGGGTNKF